MPNRFVQKSGSMLELLTRVPVNRGSLLKSIENLLKTIETSENAVMIPTLLKDKVRVDAWELLFVAKILKASILGHSDLVEFYLNHVGHTTNSTLQQQTPSGAPTSESLSPSVRSQAQQQQSPLASSPLSHTQAPLSQTVDQKPKTLSTCSTSSSNHSSAASSASTTTASSKQTGTTVNSSSGWVTANQSARDSTSLSSAASLTDSTTSSGQDTAVVGELNGKQLTTNDSLLAAPDSEQLAHEALLATANKSLLSSGRQAQPPSLLQLTTTNNHINSMNDMFSSSGQLLSPSLEQLTSQLASLQQQSSTLGSINGAASNGSSTGLATPTNGLSCGGIHFESGALSISTTSPHATLDQFLASAATTPQGQNGAAPAPPARELRSSRSAGCLFRANSGASSPRTPNQTTPSTPYPQAETLAGVAGPNGLVGDPSALVKLLLQVEQLKSSIKHVTTLLESVVELYKKSIDNIA